MKYSVLDQALALRGRRVDLTELADGRPAMVDYGVMLARPRGVVLSVSFPTVIGGPHDGAPALVATESTFTTDAEDTDTVLFLGYPDQDDAYKDALRLVVATALKDGTVEAIAGWGEDAVVLLPGAFGGFFTVRIASGMQDPQDAGLYTGPEVGPEDIHNAGAVFANMIDELSSDLAEWAEHLSAEGDDHQAGLLRELTLPWLYKEAAQHRAATARQHFLAAAHPSAGMVGPGKLITMSDLARNLYVDRGNLTRTINQALAEESKRL